MAEPGLHPEKDNAPLSTLEGWRQIGAGLLVGIGAIGLALGIDWTADQLSQVFESSQASTIQADTPPTAELS